MGSQFLGIAHFTASRMKDVRFPNVYFLPLWYINIWEVDKLKITPHPAVNFFLCFVEPQKSTLIFFFLNGLIL